MEIDTSVLCLPRWKSTGTSRSYVPFRMTVSNKSALRRLDGSRFMFRTVAARYQFKTYSILSKKDYVYRAAKDRLVGVRLTVDAPQPQLCVLGGARAARMSPRFLFHRHNLRHSGGGALPV